MQCDGLAYLTLSFVCRMCSLQCHQQPCSELSQLQLSICAAGQHIINVVRLHSRQAKGGWQYPHSVVMEAPTANESGKTVPVRFCFPRLTALHQGIWQAIVRGTN